MPIISFEESEKFWNEIYGEGHISQENVRAELHDYYNMLMNVPQVYMEVTGGRISKPNIHAEAVIGEYEAHQNEILNAYGDDEKQALGEHILNFLYDHCDRCADVEKRDHVRGIIDNVKGIIRQHTE